MELKNISRLAFSICACGRTSGRFSVQTLFRTAPTGVLTAYCCTCGCPLESLTLQHCTTILDNGSHPRLLVSAISHRLCANVAPAQNLNLGCNGSPWGVCIRRSSCTCIPRARMLSLGRHSLNVSSWMLLGT